MARRAQGGRAGDEDDAAAKPPLIVGVGASAGGVQALQTLFAGMPDDLGLAYVVILHMAPQLPSELNHILSARTKMTVTTVQGETKLEPNHVYVIPPDRELTISDHTLTASAFSEPPGRRMPIDVLFRSLARHHSDGFAIILSGAGADGSLGVKAVKEAGGIVMVQDPNEAEHASMPNAAINTGVADVVLPASELGARLGELARSPHQKPTAPVNGDEEIIRRVLAHVKVRTGHDFSKYKRSTVLRRIQRRAQVARRDGLDDYYNFLRDNADEAPALFADLLISVTAFFRDPEAFDALAAQVIPRLFDGKEAADQVRVWVPGCATGEEAYSIGMLLLEEASRREVRPEIQVFGSDLDGNGLAVARDGRYPLSIEGDVSEERLRRFFSRDSDQYQIKRELRDIVLFAGHSLLRDPPFSRIDLISCRNVMIYLERDLRQQLISTFHYALNPNGFLFLGASESADHQDGYFKVLEREAHIFQAVVGRGERLPSLPRLIGTPSTAELSQPPRSAAPARPPVEGVGHSDALEQTAPPSILVDESHHAIHLSGTAGRYLQPSGGPLSADIIELARPELRLDLRAALYRAFERNEGSLSMPILVRFNGDSRRVYLQVRPVKQGDERAPRRAIVMFIEGEAVEDNFEAAEPADERTSSEAVRRLAEELRLTQARLRTTREESEAANEELRAANEELQSINEEYRSTSEELETSKEELQSVNEELQTVNNELKLKLEGVSRANSDLQNLMAATDVGTLFLDQSLRIKRFTPRISDLFSVTTSDEGRPITNFTHQLDYDGLAADARAVLRNLTAIEREVKSRTEQWFLMRVRPYRTLDDRIDGVVVTFVDITERLRIEQALRESEERLRQEMRLVELSQTPIFVWDLDEGILQWNRGSEQLYGYPREQAVGRKKGELLKTQVPDSSFEALVQTLAESGRWSGELIQTTRDGRQVTVEAELELNTVGSRRLVLESTRDITERKTFERRQALMVAELSHRVKNTLAVVQSVAAQTIRRAGSPEEFMERFEGRLLALAAAHRLLIDPWLGADLEALARDQMGGQGEERARTVNGPSISLAPDIAVPLGLVLHELGTNAVKYGAWSVEGGSVDLNWTLVQRQDRRALRLVWTENGGPAVKEPERSGFGSVLISRGVPNARARSEFKPEGLVCTIDIPLPEEDAG